MCRGEKFSLSMNALPPNIFMVLLVGLLLVSLGSGSPKRTYLVRSPDRAILFRDGAIYPLHDEDAYPKPSDKVFVTEFDGRREITTYQLKRRSSSSMASTLEMSLSFDEDSRITSIYVKGKISASRSSLPCVGGVDPRMVVAMSFFLFAVSVFIYAVVSFCDKHQ